MSNPSRFCRKPPVFFRDPCPHARDTTTSEHGIKFAGTRSDKSREPSRGSSVPRTAMTSGESETAGAEPRDKEDPGEANQGSSIATTEHHPRELQDTGIGDHFMIWVKDPEWSSNKPQDEALAMTGGPAFSRGEARL